MNLPDRLVAHLNSYHRHDLDAALAGVAAAGYSTVELCAHHIIDDDHLVRPDLVLARLASHGVSAVALSGHTDLGTSPGLERALASLRWAAAAGLTSMTTALPGARGGTDDRERLLRALLRLVEEAEALGVVVALETHGQLMPTGAAARWWMERIASPYLGVKYDTANCEFYAGVAAVDDIHHVVPYLVNVDAKDKLGGKAEWNFPPPGEGHVDWEALVALLSAAGYRGRFTVEVEFRGEPWPAVEEINWAMARARTTLDPLVVPS